jgi:hypothetical protein
MTREEAATFLANRRFAAPVAKRAAFTKSAGIGEWFKDLSNAQKGALLGALGGGGIGLVSNLASDDEDRSWWRDSLTGVLGGGAAGLGAGALIDALKARTDTQDKLQTFYEGAGVSPGDTEELANYYKTLDPEAQRAAHTELLGLDSSAAAEVVQLLDTRRQQPGTVEWLSNLASQGVVPEQADLDKPLTYPLFGATGVLGAAATKDFSHLLQTGAGSKPRYSIAPNQLTDIRARLSEKLPKSDDLKYPGAADRFKALTKDLDAAHPVRKFFEGIGEDRLAAPGADYYSGLSGKDNLKAMQKHQAMISDLVEQIKMVDPEFNPQILRSGDKSIRNIISRGKYGPASKQLDQLVHGKNFGNMQRNPFSGGATRPLNIPPATSWQGRLGRGAGRGIPYALPGVISLIGGAFGGDAPSASQAGTIYENIIEAQK